MAEDQKELRIGAKVDKGDFREVILAFKEVERAANSMADALNRAAAGIGGSGGIGVGATSATSMSTGTTTGSVGGVASATGAGPAGRGSSLGREIKGIRSEIRGLIDDMNRLKREAQDFRSVVSGVGGSAASARSTTMTVTSTGGTATYGTPAGQMSGPPTAPTTASSSGATPPPPSGTTPVVGGSGSGDGVARTTTSDKVVMAGQTAQFLGSAVAGGAQFLESTQLLPLQAGVGGQALNTRLAHAIMTGKMSDMYAYRQLGQYAGMMQNYDLTKLFAFSAAGGTLASAGQAAVGAGSLYAGSRAGGASNPVGAFLQSQGMNQLQSGIGGTAKGVLNLTTGMYDVQQQQLMTQLMDVFKNQYAILSQGMDMYGASLPTRLQIQRQMGGGRQAGIQHGVYEDLKTQFADLGYQQPEHQIEQTMAAAKRFGFGRTIGGIGGAGSLLTNVPLAGEAQRMVPYGFDYGNTLTQFGLLSESARDTTAGMSVMEAMQGASGGRIPSFLSEQALEMVASQRMSPYGRMSGTGLQQYSTLLTSGMTEESSTLDLQQRARGLQSIGGIAQSSVFAFGSTYERLRNVIKDPMMRKIVAEAPLEKIADPNFMKAVGINANDLQIIKAAKLDPLAIGLTGKTYADVKQAGGLSKYLSSATPADRERIATQLFATQGSRVGGDIETAAAGLAGFTGQLGAVTTAAMPTAAETTDPSTRTEAGMAPSARAAVERQARLALQAGQISQIFGNLIGPLMDAQKKLQTLAGQQIGKPVAPPTAVKGH